LRSTLAPSRLVRLLGDAVPGDVESPGMDVAERLSLWLNAFDAIGLQAAQQQVRAIATAAAPARTGRPPDLAQDVERTRSVLAAAIARDPLALDHAGPDDGYGPYQQRHAELQRQMEQMIGALRGHVRESLARRSRALRQLAALDAAMEQVLAAREQALLPTVPTLLKRRFAQLRAQEGGAQAFAREWREALLAELELRLAPVHGLVAALANP
jgi:hypothetical protein